MGLVKADAYGHGAVPVAKKLEALGADYLGVACLDEALELRQAGVQTPILILGWTPALYAEELVKHQISQACYDLDYAKALSEGAQKAGGTLTVHIQCDTGMTREPHRPVCPGDRPGGGPAGAEGRGHLHPLLGLRRQRGVYHDAV